MQLEPEVILETRRFNRKRLYYLLAMYLLVIAIDCIFVIPDFLRGEVGFLQILNLILLPTILWLLVMVIRFFVQIEPVTTVTSQRLIFNAWIYGFEFQWKDLAELEEVQRGGSTILQFVMENQNGYIDKEKNAFKLLRMKAKEMIFGAAFTYSCGWVEGDSATHVATVRKAFAAAKPQQGEGPSRDWWFNDKPSN